MERGRGASYWEESPPALSCVEVSAHRASQCLRFPRFFNHPGVPGVLSWALLRHGGHFTIHDLPRPLHCTDGRIQCGPWVSLFFGEGGYHEPSMLGPIILKKLGHNKPAVPPDCWGVLTLLCPSILIWTTGNSLLPAWNPWGKSSVTSSFCSSLCPRLCQAGGPQKYLNKYFERKLVQNV